MNINKRSWWIITT